MIAHHQFITEYPIPLNSKKSIIGTIHPHNHENFIVPFYYRNQLSIWKILNKAFENEMGEKITLETILKFLKNHKIVISDTINVCERINRTALDKDLRPIESNNELVKQSVKV